MWLKTIESVAEQLCIILKDYDVAYMVAEIYVPMRVDASIKECRKFHTKLIRDRFGEGLRFLCSGSHHYNTHLLFHSMIVRKAKEMKIRRNDIWLSSMCAGSWGIPKLGEVDPTKNMMNDLKIDPNYVVENYLFRRDVLEWSEMDYETRNLTANIIRETASEVAFVISACEQKLKAMQL